MDKTSMKPAARSFGFGKALLLVGTLSGLIFGAVACADAEGTTPECTQDVGDGTHDRNAANGCNPYAKCFFINDKNKLEEDKTADMCCKGLSKETGEYSLCVAGYGAAEFPNAGTSSSSGSSSSGG